MKKSLLNNLAYLSVIGGSTLGASSGVFVKFIDLPPTSIAFFRMAVPSALLLFYFLIKQKNPFHGNFTTMIIASILTAIRIFFFYLAFSLTSIGNGIIMLYTWPILVSVIAYFYLGERQSKKEILIVVISFLGIIITYLDKEISFQSHDFMGMISMLFSAVLFSFSMVIFKKRSNTYSGIENVFFQNLIGGFVFLPFLIIERPVPDYYQTGLGLLLGFCVGFGAFSLFFYALKRMKISHYSILTYFEVIAAFIFSKLFFDEKISWNMYVGAAIIISTGYILQRMRQKSY